MGTHLLRRDARVAKHACSSRVQAAHLVVTEADAIEALKPQLLLTTDRQDNALGQAPHWLCCCAVAPVGEDTFQHVVRHLTDLVSDVIPG